MSPPPGPLRVGWLLFRLGLRRWINRSQAVFARPKKEAVPGSPRKATPRKGRIGWVWTAFFFALFIFQGITLSAGFLRRVAVHVERLDRDGTLGVAGGVYEKLQGAERARDGALARLRSDVEHALYTEDVRADLRASRAEEIVRAFEARGLAGFRKVSYHVQFRALGRRDLFSEARLWPEEGREGVVRALGFMLLALGVCQFLSLLGMANQDLGRVEWSFEWLFTMPVSARSLFFAKTVEYAFLNAYGWVMTGPLLGVFLWEAGYEGGAVPLAVAGTLLFGSVLGSLRVLAETWLRKTFPLNRLKNLQAGFTLTGTLLLLAVFGAVATPHLPAAVLDVMTGFPALWNPFSLPALLCRGGPQAGAAGLAMVAAGLAVPWAAVRLAQRCVRDGLLSTSGVYAGRRRASTVPSAGVRGVVGKDLRLLVRDRNFLVQTLVVPLVVIAFQLFLNPELLRNILSDHRHAAVAAYGVGAYVLLASAFHVLSVEGNTLWLLYTFPRDLHEILLRKTVVWAGLASIYTVALLAVGFWFAPPPEWTAVSEGLTAIVGVILYAFTVAAVGSLAVDPLQTEIQRKTRSDMAFLGMILAGLFAYAIYTPSVGQRLVQLILSALLAVALWQKVRERIPYLLDPTEEPTPRVGIADGLIALLGFFVLQGVGAGILAAAEAPKGAALLGSYVLAGGTVLSFSLFTFWRHKVPRLLHEVGFRSEEGSVAGSIGWGLGAGLAAAAAGLAYLRALDRFEVLRPLREEALELRSGLDPAAWGGAAAVAILAAPLVEEYLFRGLVYRGLRRTWGVLPSALAGALLFAIVHPPVSFAPVFVLGVLAALSFERGRRLLAPVLTHLVYNAAVVFLA